MAAVAVVSPSAPASYILTASVAEDAPDLQNRRTSLSGTETSKKKRPCDACRRKKNRCEVTDQHGTCNACVLHKRDCTYFEDPQSRKRKSGTGNGCVRILKRRYFDSLVVCSQRKLMPGSKVENVFRARSSYYCGRHISSKPSANGFAS